MLVFTVKSLSFFENVWISIAGYAEAVFQNVFQSEHWR